MAISESGSSFARAFNTLYRFMSPARRRQAVLLALLMPVAALAEMVSVASIVPLLSLLGGESGGQRLPWLSDMLAGAAGRSGSSVVGVAGTLFIAAAITAAVTRLILARLGQRFSFELGHEVSVEIQRRILHQPYLYHVGHHSSRAIASLDKVEQFVFGLLQPAIQGVGAAVIALFIAGALFWVDARSTALALVSVAAIYALILLAVRGRLQRNSRVSGEAYDKRVQAIQDSLGGIRDIIIDHSQPLYLDAFRAIDERLTRARMDSAILAIAPRFIIEAVGLAVFALLALSLASADSLAAALQVLGALALGALRLLPLLQQLYRGWASLAASRSIIDQLLDLMQLPVAPVADGPPIGFRDRIALEGVAFRYEERDRAALTDIDLVIRKGVRLALVGRTGAGKTTLADLIMGLIEPSAGKISIDGAVLDRDSARAWQRNIAHVPQSIFLADASIARNIAFARPDGPLDMDRIRRAASIAQLDEFIAALPHGFETMVGERGVRLSGGQRQRLGLARAIYKQAPVLILDEATSALDDDTEAAVLRALDQLGEAGCTVVIVAHRASTIASCDEIVRIEGGRIVAVEQQAGKPA